MIVRCRKCQAIFNEKTWVELELVRKERVYRNQRGKRMAVGWFETRICVECGARIKWKRVIRVAKEYDVPCNVCKKENCEQECKTFAVYVLHGHWRDAVVVMDENDFENNILCSTQLGIRHEQEVYKEA